MTCPNDLLNLDLGTFPTFEDALKKLFEYSFFEYYDGVTAGSAKAILYKNRTTGQFAIITENTSGRIHARLLKDHSLSKIIDELMSNQ